MDLIINTQYLTHQSFLYKGLFNKWRKVFNFMACYCQSLKENTFQISTSNHVCQAKKHFDMGYQYQYTMIQIATLT